MSGAFVKEIEEQWLHDISPTMVALVNYLTKENNNIRVYEQGNYKDAKTGKMVHKMSNGLHYVVDNDNKWSIAD